MNDKNGREWARLSQLAPGDFVCVDGGLACISDGAKREVGYSPSGLFIDCDHGHHFLSGQLGDDGDSLIGIYPA